VPHGVRLVRWTNWGRKATKKMVSFGLSRLSRTACRIVRHADDGSAASTPSVPLSRSVVHARNSR
jgi:hypothetical protein